MTKKHVIITGVPGQISHYAAKIFEENDYRVHKLRRSDTDLTDPDVVGRWIYSIQPHALVNYAAVSRPTDFSREDYANNILIVQNILEAIRKYSKLTRGIFLSSCRVFGNNATRYEQFDEYAYGFQDERTEKNPLTMYAKSKHACDTMVLYYRQKYDLSLLNVIQYGAESTHRRTGPFLFTTIKQWMKEAAKGNIGSLQELSNVQKEVMHAEDAARAHFLLAEANSVEKEYLVGSGAIYTMYDIIKEAISIVNPSISIDDIVSRYNNHKVLLCSDCSKLRRHIDWVPRYTLNNILQELWANINKEEFRHV